MNVSFATTNSLRYVDPDGRWRTYTENGVSYAYREPPIDPLIRSVASYFSGFEMADCIIRSAQGDVTLSKSDWIWAAVDIAIPVASEVSKSAGLKQALKDIQKATYGVGFYEGASEYEKAKDLDPVIFERYTATTGIKEQPFGVVSGKYRILIRNAEDLKTLKCISKEVANEKKNENKPPELHLEPRDYWHYNVQ
ncbi:MAG: hypothetical protein ABIL18_03320 [candidate division WOR-3 bacterium]